MSVREGTASVVVSPCIGASGGVRLVIEDEDHRRVVTIKLSLEEYGRLVSQEHLSSVSAVWFGRERAPAERLELRYGDLCRADSGAPARYLEHGICVWISCQENTRHVTAVNHSGRAPAPSAVVVDDAELAELASGMGIKRGED